MDRTTEAVWRQTGAMGADIFELGLFKPEQQGAAGEPVMLPRTWDRHTLMKSISWLRFENSRGRNIYIRPHGEHNLCLVDDLTPLGLTRMKSTGFNPALTVETSPGNYQAWLKHPAPLSRELGTAAARALAKEFGGDLGAADWRHFGRLGGFTNRKPCHRNAAGFFPFVRLVEAGGEVYPEADRFVRQVTADLDVAQRRLNERAAMVRPAGASRATRSIEDFRANPVYNGDGTRIDLAYAIYSLAHGAPEADVRAAIQSRDLAHKGNERRQAEYVERTVCKAYKLVAQRGRALGR